jgi:Ras-related protein Rab-24
MIYEDQKVLSAMRKVILVGSSGVGKTCLLSAFMQQAFDQHSLPTTAPAFSPVPVLLPDGRSVELQVWDTAGQEVYRSISQVFYRDAQAAIVCFEPSTINSIAEWITAVQEFADPKCSIYFAGTKIDILSAEDADGLLRAATALCTKYNAPYFPTSSCTGQGVSDLLEAIATDMSGRELPEEDPARADLGAEPVVDTKAKVCC